MGPVHTLLLLAGWALAQDRPKTVAFQGKYRSWGTPALPSLSSSVFGGRQCWGGRVLALLLVLLLSSTLGMLCAGTLRTPHPLSGCVGLTWTLHLSSEGP